MYVRAFLFLYVRTGKSFTSVRICKQGTAWAVQKMIKSLSYIVLSNQTATLHHSYFWNQSCQAVPHFPFLFFYSSLLLPCYFSTVVRNDLNFFTSFISRLKLVTLICFLLFFVRGIRAGAAKLHPFLWRVYVHVRVWKWHRALNDSPILCTRNETHREHVAICW